MLQVDSEAWFRPQTMNAGPPARVFHSAAADGSYLYVFGGHAFQKEGKGIHKYNDLWRLNTVHTTTYFYLAAIPFIAARL